MGNKRKLSNRRSCFLKFLDADFSRQQTIPLGFTKNFNGNMPHWFILEIPGTRKCWRVDIEQNGNGELYFGYGWHEFVEEQYLEVGYFLLFEYEEPLILRVKIFDKDGAETTVVRDLDLEYEVEASECQKQTPQTQHGGEADMWSTRPSDQWALHEKPPEIIDHTDIETDKFWPRYVVADQCGVHEQQQEIIERIKMETANRCLAHEKEQEVNDRIEMETVDACRVHEKQQVIIDRTERKKSKLSATEQGVCYSLIWRKAHHLYYYLTIPRSMVIGRTFSSKEAVLLKDQEGTIWPMKLRMRPGGRVDLTQGWKEFLVENDIADGDKLTFMFVSDKMIQVNVERASQVDHPSQISQPSTSSPMASFNMACEHMELPAHCAINHSTPENVGTERVSSEPTSSTFSTTWTRKTRSSYMHIPKAVAVKQKLENQDTVVLCDPEGNQWPTKVRTRNSDGRVGLGQGWNEFCKGHKIDDGDTLIFEFVTDHMIKVNIIRALQVDQAASRRSAMKKEAVLFV